MHSAAAVCTLLRRWHMGWEYVAERCSHSTAGGAAAKIPPLSVGERQRGLYGTSMDIRPCQEKVSCGLLLWLDAQRTENLEEQSYLLVFSTHSNAPICNLAVTGVFLISEKLGLRCLVQLIKYLKDTWLLELLNMSLQITLFQPPLIKDFSPCSLFSATLPSARGNPEAWMGQTPSAYHCHCFLKGWAEQIQGRRDGCWFSHPHLSCTLLLEHHLIWESKPEGQDWSNFIIACSQPWMQLCAVRCQTGHMNAREAPPHIMAQPSSLVAQNGPPHHTSQ